MDLFALLLYICALALGIAMMLAQFKLFAIARILEDIKIELQQMRAAQLPDAEETAQKSCPSCGSGCTEVYERSRDGVGWICRACQHTWTGADSAVAGVR